MESSFKNEEIYVDNKGTNDILNPIENVKKKTKNIFIILITFIFPIIEFIIHFITIYKEREEEYRRGDLLKGLGTVMYIIIDIINELITIGIGIICYFLYEKKILLAFFLCAFMSKSFVLFIYLSGLLRDLKEIMIILNINIIIFIIYYLICFIYLILYLIKMVK